MESVYDLLIEDRSFLSRMGQALTLVLAMSRIISEERAESLKCRSAGCDDLPEPFDT